MIIPENIILTGIRSFIALATASYIADVTIDKNDNILYDLFNTDDNGDVLALDNFNYYKQAVAIITKPNTEVRQLDIFQGYNQQRQGLPTIHVLLPSESKGREDSIGDSVGNPAVTFDTVTNLVTLTKEKSFAPTYNLMITSSNSAEVLLIYYFLRSMFIAFDQHFELSGLRDVRFSGADITFQPDLPPGIFHRNLSISFDYIIQVKVKFLSSINIGFIIAPTVCDE